MAKKQFDIKVKSLFNIHGQSSLPKLVAFIFGTNIVNNGLLFLASILVFRSVDKSEYGLGVFLMSLFAISELFMGGYNQAIQRYLKDDIPLIDKQKILIYIFYYRLGILFLFAIGISILYFGNYLHYLLNDYDKHANIIGMYMLIIFFIKITSIFISVENNVLISLYQYKISAKFTIMKNFFYLSFVSAAIFLTSEYIYFMLINLFLSIGLFIFIFKSLDHVNTDLSLKTIYMIKPEISIYQKYLMSYSSPLTMVSLLTYAKIQLPVLVLGKEFALEDVAIYSIMRNFFKTLHSIFGSYFSSLTSKFIEMKNKNYIKYKKTVNIIFYTNMISRIVVFVICIALSDYFFQLYNIETTALYKLIFMIIGAEFILAGNMSIYGWLIMHKDSTLQLLYISILRFLVELILIYLILVKFGILGASLVLLLSRFFELLFTYFIYDKKLIIYSTVLILTTAIFVFFISYKGLSWINLNA